MQARTESFWDSSSCRKYTIVWYVEFSGKKTISQIARGAFQKHLHTDLKYVTNCLSALLILPSNCLWKRNLAEKLMNFDHACTTTP